MSKIIVWSLLYGGWGYQGNKLENEWIKKTSQSKKYAAV